MYEQVSFPVGRGDRISALPDEIICIILSNLYVEESARTSILSKRWHKIWLLSPITISDESITEQSCNYSNHYLHPLWIVNAMSHIISTHPGPVHTCHFILPIWDQHRGTLVNLLRTLTQKGIQNLQIHSDYNFLEVPRFVLECNSLVDVKLYCVSIPDQLPACRNIFPNLRKLTMVSCDVNDALLVNLLPSKSLIKLKLSTCFGFGNVIVIESDSLRKIFFSVAEIDTELTPGEFDTELIIKDVPNLESFKFYHLTSNSKVVILNAPKLKVSCIDMSILMLQLGNYRFRFHKKYMKISGEITRMPCLRSLSIRVNFDRGYAAKSIPHFLMCFPCLETLKVWMGGHYPYYSCDSSSDGEYNDNDNNENEDNANDAAAVVVDDDYVHLTSNINCLNHHLKNVRVRNYSGRQAHLDFAKLIVANARVLETVTIVYDNDFEKKWIKGQRQFLMQNRASKMLRVEFLKRW